MLSIFDSSFTIKNYQFRPTSIFSDLTNSQKEDSLLFFKKKSDSLIAYKRIADSMKLNFDSIKLAEEQDLRISDYRADGLELLGKFFASLAKTQKKEGITRIAYFGDSMIEGDLITQTLRAVLQSTFGGSGVGFVPVFSKTGDFRRTIHSKYSTNWRGYSYLEKRGYKNFGISGFVFNPNVLYKDVMEDTVINQAVSWVQFTAPYDTYYRLRNFENARLFYGKSNNKNFVRIDYDTTKKFHPLTGQNIVNDLTINFTKPTKRVGFNFYIDTLTDVYGFSFDGKDGLYLDNFSVRSNSGLPILSIPTNVLKGMNEYMNYNLVVLQYGMNVTTPSGRNFSWYEEGMEKVIKHIRECMPNADILVISVGDRSHKVGTEMKTMSSIPYLVEAQRKIAQETNCAFLNLYQTMGGANSMVKWADTIPALANKDYTHFNFRGAEKIGNLISDKILNEYKIYQFKQH